MKRSKAKIDSEVLIFSGSNDRAVISFCRFAVARNIRVNIIARNQNDKILKTIYKKYVFGTRKQEKINIKKIIYYIKKLRKTKKYSCKILILPSTEYINRILIENIKTLNKIDVKIGLCKKEIYQNISDKYSFGELCKKYKINIPREINFNKLKYPFVIKPRKYFNSNNTIDKPIIIETDQDFKKNWKDKNKQDYYFQEYIGGRSFYLLYYFLKNQSYQVFSQENLIQQHNGGSMILAKSSNIHKSKISQKIAKMIQDIKFHGLIMVEIKYFNSNFYMIEANPRLWGPSQLILDSNMNLFEYFAWENKLITRKKKEKYKNNIWYFWSGGIVITNKKSQKIKFYSFTEKEFTKNYHEIINSEIYLKKDTMNIFLEENKTKK